MKENEFNQFSEIWRAYANIINPTTAHNDVALLIIFRKLMPYSLSQVTKALDTISCRSNVFSLNMADVMNELKGFNKETAKELANIIFEDVAIDHTLYALGWNMSYLNSEQCDPVYSKKDFVNQYLICAQKAQELKHLVLKGSSSAENHTKLVSASKTSYGNPVTWTLSEEDKETILLGNDDSSNVIRRITAELPKIPVLPDEEKRDPAPPADIRRQKEIIEKTMNALLGA